MASLKINLFGEFSVRRGRDPVESEEWDRQKTRSLLKLLLTRPGRVFSRDEIIDALWPDAPPKAAERSLWVTISLLRRALEPDLGRGSDSRYILQKRPGYAFNLRSGCRVDAWEFEEHQDKAEAARKAGELDEAIEEYRVALDLARGEFLAEDPYEEWAMEARREWQERRLSVLSNLSECLAQKGRYTQAIEFCEKALSLDRYREELHRRLMLYHYCAGEQALALRVYRDYARTLEEELDADPSPELTRLRDQIDSRDVPGVDEMRRYPKPRHPLKFPYSLSRTHFVGRDKEYALLAERLREVQQGMGRAIAVEGEAGVGKTRLAEEFLGYARSHGVQVLSGRCYERELGAPLEPILEALEPLIDTSSALAAEGPEMPDHLLAHEQETAYERTRVYRALAGELVRESRDTGQKALILFVDDLQWADSATLEFLPYLAKRIVDERILLLFTYRREDAPGLSGWLDHLAERRAVTTLSLDRLWREDLAQILGRMSSLSFEELASLAAFLHRESEGNPFYAVEYLRWLIEAGTVEIDSRRRICALESEGLREGALPSGVRALIQTRLSTLGEEARNLIEFAAVIGRSFALDLLCEAASQGEARVFASLKPVMASGLVVETPQETYYFAHDKLRQAIYEDIETPHCRDLHLRVARALEDTKVEPAELAHHYLRAKTWRPALENLMLAAKKAERNSAWDTALENCARALEVVGELPESEETRFELLASRERLLEHMDRHEERAEAVEEMSELAKRLEDLPRVAQVHVRRIGVLMALSDPEGATEAGQTAISVFQELGDEAGEARVHREMGYVLWVNGDYAGALEANFRALRIHHKLGNLQGEAGAAMNIAQVYRGMGDQENTLRWTEEAARIYRELGDELGEAVGLHTMAAIHLERGDLESALSLTLKSLRMDAGIRAKNLDVAEHNTCGTLYLRLGNPREALKYFRTAVRISREIGYTRDEGYSLMSVGVSLEQLGDFAGAAVAIRSAIELLQTAYEESGIAKELSAKADALTVLGRLLHRSLDEPVEALDAYRAATGIYRELGNTHRLQKSLLRLAGLRWRMGDLEGSARDYEEALELAQEHGEATDEAAALASLSVAYRDLGRLRESLRCGRAARDMLRDDLEDPQAESYVLTSLADSYSRLEHYPSALACLKRSLRLRRKMGDKAGEVRVLYALAKVYANLQDPGRAQDASEEAARKEEALAGATQVVALGAERRN